MVNVVKPLLLPPMQRACTSLYVRGLEPLSINLVSFKSKTDYLPTVIMTDGFGSPCIFPTLIEVVVIQTGVSELPVASSHES